MGKLMLLLYFILSVFPADATENRRHIHVVRRGSKKSHRGDTVAKIWIEENGVKKIEIAWSELNAAEEAEILKAIDEHWEELNQLIDDARHTLNPVLFGMWAVMQRMAPHFFAPFHTVTSMFHALSPGGNVRKHFIYKGNDQERHAFRAEFINHRKQFFRGSVHVQFPGTIHDNQRRM